MAKFIAIVTLLLILPATVIFGFLLQEHVLPNYGSEAVLVLILSYAGVLTFALTKSLVAAGWWK